jgi:16S rRNA (cytidine1402-2'-O)-methyltransferase
LVPVTLGDDGAAELISPQVRARVCALGYFIVEEPKRARAFLKDLGHPKPLSELRFEKLDADADEATIDRLLASVLEGTDAAVLSAAGAPAIADPGALVVRHAHRAGVRVVPLVGPSAILLALMASGLEGQRFVFHGYLPVEEGALRERLRALEADSRRERRTEIFIETPYRNDRLLRLVIATCAPDCLLCVAAALTLPGESIATRTIAEWRARSPTIGKQPAVFLLLAAERH